MAPILGIYASQISGHLFAPSGAYDSIATTTVGAGGTTSVLFSSIPQGYTHLQLRMIARSDRAVSFGSPIYAQFNSDTAVGNYYETHGIYGDGTTAGTVAFDGGAVGGCFVGLHQGANGTANAFAASVTDILDYSNSNKNKTVRSLNGNEINGGNTNSGIQLYSSLWMNTNAITSINLIAYHGNTFQQYTQFALYGIRGA
jgi:hypothetical protein